MEIRAKISLAVEQFKTGAAVVGGLYKGMTVDAQKHTQNVDKFINKNLNNRIEASRAGNAHDMAMLNQYERKFVASSRRLDKERIRAQAGAVDNRAAYDDFRNKNLLRPPVQKVERAALRVDDISARKNAEREYTKWWATELQKRDYQQFWNSSKVQKQLTRNDQKMWRENLRERSRAERKEALASFAYRTKYDIIYAAGVMRRAMANRNAKIEDRVRAPREIPQLDGKALNSARYALYDIGSKLTAAGVGIAAALGAAIMKSAEFESAFTRVERTSGATGVELQNLKKSLLDIAATSPVSYEDITAIATLGAQMGIAADALDDFSRTVSNFSSITGVSVEQAAMAFGRLGELLDVPASKFENLSAAITFVGVNSVATDREILAMSESIAAASNQAGFAADEVIGLSGALASLKVRPEEARGVIVRLFREIDSSVSEGGARLADFGKLMGYTSAEASALWKQDPSKFFQSFLEGAKASGDLNGAITALGITNSRELNVIQRLANNTDVLASTMRDAREQYLLGTYASDAYGKVQDDLSSKLKILQNNIDQVIASFGESAMGPMKEFVDRLIEVAKFLGSLPTPVKFVITVMAALASGFLIFKGTILLAIAGLFAMKTAMTTMGVSSIRGAASLTALRTAMGAVGLASAKSAFTMTIFGKTVISAATSAKVATGATKALTASMIFLQKAFLPLLIIGTVAVAIASIAEANANAANESSKLGDAMIEAGGGVEELRTAMMKDTAVYKKTGQQIGELKFNYDELVQTEGKAKIAVLQLAAGQDNLVSSIQGADVATGELVIAKESDAKATEEQNELTERAIQLTKEQTVALGANTAAFVARSLSAYGTESKNFYEEFSQNQDKALWEAAGFDIAKLIAAGLTKDGGATEYVEGVTADLLSLEKALFNAFATDTVGAAVNKAAVAEKAIEKWGQANGKTAVEIDALTEAMRKNNFTVTRKGAFDELAKSVDTYRESVRTAAAASELQIQVLIDQGFSAESAADQVGGLSDQLKKYLANAFSTINATGKLYGAFNELSDGVKETDGSFDVFSESGRKNMANFQSFAEAALDAATVAGTGFTGGLEKIAAGLIVLEQGGYDTANAFAVMRQFIGDAAALAQYTDLSNNIKTATDPSQLNEIISAWILTKDSTTEAGIAAIDYGNKLRAALTGGGYAKLFLMQWEMTRKETAKTATNVKTILQYASELGRVLKEAVDIKFSRTSGLITLRNTVADINKNIKDARKSIIDLQASISEKTADRDQLNADLDLASQFGDVAEVSRLRSEIATLNSEISSAQEDVAYNVGIATGSLDLNTQAGRDNASTIQGLTTSYADYIQSLVASGASTDTVNKEIGKSKTAFEKQLTAMGLSKKEMDEYSDIFDGFLTIAKKVPKDVTVEANTNPAITALNNFLAQVNSSKASVEVTLDYATRAERLKALQTERARLAGQFAALKKSKTPLAAGQMSVLRNQMDSIDNDIKLGMYHNGGPIRGTGGNQQDNIPIMASRGEFMMSAGSVSRYGVDFMNALNQQRVGISGFGGGMSAAGNSSGGVVYLSARDRELLQAAINRPVTLKTTNRIIAQSANDGNKELTRNGAN